MRLPIPRRLEAFIQISLDGYYCDLQGDMSFAHKPGDDAEWGAFVAENARGGGTLLFGRRTYEMMAAWWPTPMAAQAMPEVAAGMNARPKIVFSRTLEKATWSNTELVRGDAVTAVRRLKEEPGPGMTLLGSGSLVSQLGAAGLLDGLQVVLVPIALGAGRSLFSGLADCLHFSLSASRVFRNGSVVLWYAPRESVRGE